MGLNRGDPRWVRSPVFEVAELDGDRAWVDFELATKVTGVNVFFSRDAVSWPERGWKEAPAILSG